MKESLTLEIVTPVGFAFTEEVDEVVAPGTEGQFGVLPGHTSFLTTLEPGTLVYKKGATLGRVSVKSAYVQVVSNHVLVLADSAELENSTVDEKH
ncbi:MAG: ATP synthase F1 subunit epsilon [Nitrospirae bacterium]|uniref:ATP synthase F1 subunit epsilon n=1 Tax=Candidatus Magnetobacterium casense TaxID=1455061 RepID=UPI0005913F56